MTTPQGAAYTKPFRVLDVEAFKQDFANVDEISVVECEGLDVGRVQVFGDDGFWPAMGATRDGEETQQSVAEIIIPHLLPGERVIMLSASYQGPRSVQADVVVFDRDGSFEEESIFETAARLDDELDQSIQERRNVRMSQALQELHVASGLPHSLLQYMLKEPQIFAKEQLQSLRAAIEHVSPESHAVIYERFPDLRAEQPA